MSSKPRALPIRKQCLTCQRLFESRNRAAYCSKACWPSRAREKRLHTARALDLASNTIGTIGELTICADLLLKGYAVFRALSPACYCDVLAKRFETVWQIEVRTGYQRNGRYYCVKTYQQGVNCIGFWDKETNEVVYFTPGTWLPLTLEEPLDVSRVSPRGENVPESILVRNSAICERSPR